MRCDYPTMAQIPGLRALWKEAFEDTDLFLDAFFDRGFHPHRCRCITEQGAVLTALYWFEVSCCEQRYAYLYAVATAKNHRGRGLFRMLLEDTKLLLRHAGFHGILLVPETESLARMYEKFGFSVSTYVREFSVKASGSVADLREIGPDEFARLRRSYLPADSVLQEGADLDFLATQCHFWAGEGWLAAGQIYDGKLVCQEFLGDEKAIPGLVKTLGVPCGHIRTAGTERPFAYLLPLRADCECPAYFAFALD